MSIAISVIAAFAGRLGTAALAAINALIDNEVLKRLRKGKKF